MLCTYIQVCIVFAKRNPRRPIKTVSYELEETEWSETGMGIRLL